MAHFAKIENINGVNKVTTVLVVPDEQEHRASDYLQELGIEGTWIQCSINTRKGKHLRNKTPLRKNYPRQGFIYDEVRDAFIPPKPEKTPSFVIDDLTGTWVPPIPYPLDRYVYIWNEEQLAWVKDERSTAPIGASWIWDAHNRQWVPPIPYPNDGLPYAWNEETQSWRLMTELKNDLDE